METEEVFFSVWVKKPCVDIDNVYNQGTNPILDKLIMVSLEQSLKFN